MATTLKIRRGDTATLAARTPALAELSLNTDNNRLIVGDGVTVGGAASFLNAADIAAAYQPLDADLTIYAGITPSANVQTVLGAANFAAIRTALDLVVGTNVQAFHARLTDVAGASWVQGDIMYFNGSNLVRLAPGTSGHFLKTQGAAANPIWDAASGGATSLDGLSDVAITASTIGEMLVHDGTNYVDTRTIASGTITASDPLTFTQTWNSSGVTFVGLDIGITATAAAAASRAFRVMVGGTERFAVGHDNSWVFKDPAQGTSTVTLSTNGFNVSAALGAAGVVSAGSGWASFEGINSGHARVYQPGSGTEIVLQPGSSNHVVVRNDTTAMAFRIYETFTDASNYERGAFTMGNDTLTIAWESAGTGALNGNIVLTPKGTGKVQLPARGISFGDNNWRWFRDDATEIGPQFSLITLGSGAGSGNRQFIWRDGLAPANRLAIHIGPLDQSSTVVAANSFTPTINQSGTAGYTALHVNVTETATGSGANNLLDLQVGSVSKFAVSNAGVVTLPDTNIVLGTTTGTKIGTATSQKLAFFNATPVVQRTVVADPSGGAIIDAECRTAVIAVITRLEELGLFASA